MKITGKYIADIHSSFVEFEVDELPSKDEQDEITENASCYEAIWMGEANKNDNNFNGSPSLMIGMDDCTMEDLELLLSVMSEGDVDEIKEIKSDKY